MAKLYVVCSGRRYVGCSIIATHDEATQARWLCIVMCQMLMIGRF